MTQDMKKEMILHTITKQLVRNWCTRVLSAAHSSSLTSALRTMLLLLIVTLGVGEVWAADYKYIIINNKGNEAFNYIISTGTTYTSIDKTKFCIHPKAKSVLATNFRFYTTKADAQADANGTIGTHYSEGDAIPTPTNENKTIYVRYDLVSSPAININGVGLYKLQIHGRNNKSYFIYYDSQEEKLKINDTDDGTETEKFLWRFESGDPYDVYIRNLKGMSIAPSKVVSTTGAESGNTDDNKGKKANYQQKIADDNYNQSSDPMASLQSFIIMQNSYGATWWSEGMYQVVGAYNGIDNKPKDVKPTSTNEIEMPYYIGRNNKAPANGDELDFARSWRNEDSDATSNPSQINFIQVSKNYTFHIINNSDVETVKATVSLSSFDETITASMIPDVIKTPFASYKFYPTAEDAIAGTNELSSLSYNTTDIYVRYTLKSGDLDLSSAKDYNLKVAGANYLYASDASTIGVETTETNAENSTHLWKADISDPYQVTIKNKENNKYLSYDVSSGETIPALSDTGSKFFLHTGKEGKYEVVAITSDDFTNSGYYTLGLANSTLKMYSSSNYPMGSDAVQSEFFDKTKASITTHPIANSLSYDGTDQALVTAGVANHGTMKYRLGDTGDYSETIPTGRIPGTYQIYYMAEGSTEGDIHYGDFIVLSPISVTIDQRVVTPTITAANKEYDGSKTATVSSTTLPEKIDGDDLTLDVTSVTGTFSNANVGNGKTVTFSGFTLSGSHAAYYQLASATCQTTANITAKEIGIEWGTTTFVYNGHAQKPTATATGLIGSNKCDITVTGEQTNAGDYTAMASSISNPNYKLPSANTQAFIISQKDLADAEITITMIKDDVNNTYTVVVKHAGIDSPLTPDVDYVLEQSMVGGDAVVTITATENGNYKGSQTATSYNPEFVNPDDEQNELAAAVYKSSSDLVPADVKAYIVKKVNPSVGTISIAEISYIPEGVPVLLLAETERIGFTGSPKAESIYEITETEINSNLLRYADQKIDVEKAQVYVFYKGEFVLTTAGKLGVGSFYLNNPNYSAASGGSGGARSFARLRFVVENDATGIFEIGTNHDIVSTDDRWYTLDGSCYIVKPNKKGIYIHCGRKVVIK